MRTFVIFTDYQSHPDLLILEGCLQHLDGVDINCTEDQAKQDELNALLYDEQGNFLPKVYGTTEWAQSLASCPGSSVIKVGFIP